MYISFMTSHFIHHLSLSLSLSLFLSFFLIVSSMSYGHEDPVLKLVHSRMKLFLSQEEELMEQRIRLVGMRIMSYDYSMPSFNLTN